MSRAPRQDPNEEQGDQTLLLKLKLSVKNFLRGDDGCEGLTVG